MINVGREEDLEDNKEDVKDTEEGGGFLGMVLLVQIDLLFCSYQLVYGSCHVFWYC